MKTIRVTDYGIFPSETQCCSEALTNLIAEYGDDCEILFPAGVYFLSKRVTVTGKKNLTLRGEDGTTIRMHFCNTNVEGLEGAFGFVDCTNLALKNFSFDMDVSPNIAGEISRINEEEGWFEIKFYDEFHITGNERLEAINTVDPEYTPDYRFVTYDVVEHTYMGDSTFRFDAEKVAADLSKLYVGLLVNVRHIRYGAHVAGFTGVDGCEIEDIEITAAPGCVFVIMPRSSNFTFTRFNIRLPKNTKRIMAANADGIHVAGVTGKFVMKDCHFENLGDDALNIHSKACMVTAIDHDARKLDFHAIRMVAIKDPATHQKTGQKIQTMKFPMNPRWINPGDLIYVYDQETVAKLGEIRVISWEESTMHYEVVSGAVEEGNILANAEYYAATHIDGCSVRNTRARAFLIQTNNAIIENCHIYGMSMSAFLLSPDVTYWYEVGPCDNVLIRNNHIEKCTTCIHRNNIGAIVLKCRHEEGITDTPAGTHRNIRIIGNTFKNIGNSAIFALAVQNLEIKENSFKDCSNYPFDDELVYLKHDVSLVNCDQVDIASNTTDREPDHLYFENVTNVRVNN